MLLLTTLSILLLATTSAALLIWMVYYTGLQYQGAVLYQKKEYLVTIPQKWAPGSTSQVCLSVTSTRDSQVSITLSLFGTSVDGYTSLIDPQDITFDFVKMPSCVSIDVPSTSMETGQIKLAGEIDGARIVETRKITFVKTGHRTFIQPDKYLYKAGQTVHFRVLTTEGPFFNVSYSQYSEIYIESPSSSRIAQWLNVTNNGGLIHKEFQLIDEPEKGIYHIFVTSRKGEPATNTSFKVIDYVLPRFEVKIIKPLHIGVSDFKTTFKVCANYTFGQPLNGRVSGNFSINNEDKERILLQMFNEQIFGCRDLEFSLPVLGKDLGTPSKVHLKLRVEEIGTKNFVEEKASLSISSSNLKLVERNTTEFKKPDLPFVVSVQAFLSDGTPASSEPFSACFNGDCPTVHSDRNGYLKFAVPPHLLQDEIMLTRINEDRYSTSKITISAEKYFSPSNSSLQLLPEDSNTITCEPGSYVRLNLQLLYSARDVTEADLRIQLISRGQIQYSNGARIPLHETPMPFNINLIRKMKEHNSDDNIVRGVALLSVAVPPSMSPSVKVLVWYTRPDGEIVPASREFEISKCLPHQVSMSWPQNKVEHGITLPLTLTAEPESLCSVGIIDKSAELLTPPHKKFSIQTLFKTLDNFNPNSDDANQIDDQKYCQVPEYLYPVGRTFLNWEDFDESVSVTTDLSINDDELENTEIPTENNVPRTHFPETWLWKLFAVNDRVHHETLTLPDTITEWVGNAVCVHPEKGVGISAPTSITTFTPFFIDITMVPNIIMGEVMPIVISVFNYLDIPLPVRVTVTPSSKFKIYIDNNPTTARDQPSASTFTLCVPQGDKNTVNLRMKPLEVCDVEMKISATVDGTISSCEVSEPLPYVTDTIIKKFNVEFEGFPKEKTSTNYICADDPNYNENFERKLNFEAPLDIVPDSARSWITVDGDLLGSTLENFGNLIKKPSGCGEQIMLNFAPNIYILQYLESTSQLDDATKDKLINFMNVGYQREQMYKHPDGSYSVWGKDDPSGSTWLTAFVVKSFAQARSYINVDSADLLKSLNWLKSTQQQDGCFKSHGYVLLKRLKVIILEENPNLIENPNGGLSNGNGKLLSAYITAALVEAGEDPSSDIIVKALSCLKEGGITSRDPYELSLLAHALSLAKDPSADTTINNLLRVATKSPDGVHWYLENSNGKQSSSSAVIETAGYALIAMLESDVNRYFETAKLIVNWISEQRNSQGGYSSTQDTVIALQALSLFESYLNHDDQNLVVRFQGTVLNSTIHVSKENRLLNQRIEVKNIPNTVLVSMEGSGCILTQGVVRYNVKDPETSESFNLAVSTSSVPQKCLSKTIRVCASYLLTDGKSNMAVIEISLVSGYGPYKEDLVKVIDDSNREINRYELDGRKVLFYVDHFTPVETCVEFSVLKEVDMENPKPGTVKIYDYYESEFEITEKYEFTDEDCLGSNTAPRLPSNPRDARNENYIFSFQL